MYLRRLNDPRTSTVEKESTSKETKLDYENTRQVDMSRHIYYGLRWTPSRDENLSTDEVPPRTLSSSPPILDTIKINDRRIEYSLSNPYELNKSSNLSKTDRQNHFEKSTKFSTKRTSSDDRDYSSDHWLSGEKFFKTPQKCIYNIPTHDTSNNENNGEGRQEKKNIYDEIILYDTEKTLIDGIDDLKPTKDTNNYDSTINRIRRSSSIFPESIVERDTMKKNVEERASRSTIERATCSRWNLVESVTSLGRTNVHNHIYLSSGCLNRYLDIPLSKFLKITRRNSRVRGIRHRILKKPKRSKSRLIGAACRVTSAIEMDSFGNNNNKGQKGDIFSKKDVCEVLAEIDTELIANLRSVERLRELLPSCIPIDTIFTAKAKGTLNEVTRRFKDSIRNSNVREESLVKMDERLLKIVGDLLDVIKGEKFALLQEVQYYTRLQSVSIAGREDFQKIKHLREDADRIMLNGFRENPSHWKALVKKLLNDALTLTNEICATEDNKENIKKSINRKTNDRNLPKRLANKFEGKATLLKKKKRLPTKEENQVDTQMSLLSEIQPTVSTGKLKISTKDLDGYRDRIKVKDIGDQRNRILKENEDRPEKQSLDKTKRSLHTVLNVIERRLTAEGNSDNPKVNDATKLSGSCRRRQNSNNNAPQPIWKPGGPFKSLGLNSSTVVHVEPALRSVPVKHANPSEPTASGKTILKENRKSESFREERVTKLFKLLAQEKMQKRSKNGGNGLSETRSSTYTQSEMPLSGTSGAKTLVKSSEVNLSRRNSAPKLPPRLRKFAANNKLIANNLQRDTKIPQDTKSETLPSKNNFTDKHEQNNSCANFSMKFDEKNQKENEDVLKQQELKELVTLDTTKSSMTLLDDQEKPQNTQSSTSIDNELTENVSRTNSMFSNPEKSTVTTLNSSNAINVDCDLRSDSGPSFVSVADASCNAEFSSASNSTMMVPSSKCCQVSLSSSSSRTNLNYDQLSTKNQSIEKDSLKSSTDDESNYLTPLSSDRPKRKNKHKLSINSLKDFLHDLGIEANLIQKIEKEYLSKNQYDQRKSVTKSNNTSPYNISKSFISTKKGPVIKVSIDPETDIQSSKKYGYKSDNDRSIESKVNSDCSKSMCTEKIEESMLERKKSIGSQTISNLKEFCDAYADTEDMKPDCSIYVDAMVSCNDMHLKTSFKDVSTEIIAEDKSVLSPQRSVQIQTDFSFTSIDSLLELNKEEKQEDNSKDRSMETKGQQYEQFDYENQNNISQTKGQQYEQFDCENQINTSQTKGQQYEQSDYKNQTDVLSQHDVSKNDNEKSSECLLNSEGSYTIAEPQLPHCLIHQLEDIKEQLQNVDEKLNKLKEPTKETTDAFSQISAITSIDSKPIEITSSSSGISMESFKEFNLDFIETKENCISNDIITAFQAIELYAANWNEALAIYKEYSNVKRFEEYEKSSTCSSSSDEIINVSKKTEILECNIPESSESVNEDCDHSCDYIKTEIATDKPSCSFSERQFRTTQSLPSFFFEDFYGEEMTKSTSTKSSCGSIFFETKSEIDKVSSTTITTDPTSATMKHSEGILDENEEIPDAYDSEFVLSRETLLLLTYLTICAFVFCCLKFSMTCESLIL